MQPKKDIQSLFFLGIGGIGMSAIARYFQRRGERVLGYDRTSSPLTKELEREGIGITYTDSPAWVEAQGISPCDTLVVRTPAVPESNAIYTYLRAQGYDIVKRSEVLGLITHQKKALCVAGTHGKTTTSAILAHIMHESKQGASAFLGGISNNYQSNLIVDKDSDYVVVEADEFDRSFHHLKPHSSIITSIEPDHLDIYGDAKGYQEGFDRYAELVENFIVLKAGFHLPNHLKANVFTYTGPKETGIDADFYADNIRIEDGEILFDFCVSERAGLPFRSIQDVRLGVPVWINIENTVAAMAIAALYGTDTGQIRDNIKSYRGVWRRFNVHLRTPKIAYIDDYAHHPTELDAAIQSVRKVYGSRSLWAVFQPHLYTRTRDFMDGFADVLSKTDKLILLSIYPAREEPIEGITSEALAQKVKERNPNADVIVVEKDALIEHIQKHINKSQNPIAIMTLGAGDIDRLVNPLKETLSQL